MPLGSNAAFCEYHHRRAGGVLSHVSRDGTLLRERAFLGSREAPIGLYPNPAVGVTGLRRDGENLVQNIQLCRGSGLLPDRHDGPGGGVSTM